MFLKRKNYRSRSFFVMLLMSGLLVPGISSLAAQSKTSTLYRPDEYAQVMKGEMVSSMYVKYDAKKENTPGKIVIPASGLDKRDYSDWEVKAADIYFLPFDLSSESDHLRFYQALTAYSRLQGMNYYSRSDASVQLLVEKCYQVKSPASRNAVADPVYTTVPTKSEHIFYQKDNKFGSLHYRNEILRSGKDYYVTNTCLEPLKKLLISINDPEEYVTGSVFIYDEEKKGFFSYSYLCVRVHSDLMLKNGLIRPTSFSNRLRAATVHFTGLLGVDRKKDLNPWKGLYDN